MTGWSPTVCPGMGKIRYGNTSFGRGFLCQFSFHQLLHIHTSYYRRYIVSMQTASLSNKLKK
jgi:hypothetical protein